MKRPHRPADRALAHHLHLPGLEPEVVPDVASSVGPPAPAASPEPAPQPARRPDAPAFNVEVIRSKQRRKSVSAQLVGDTLRLAIPAWMSAAEEQHWVVEMSRRFHRKTSTERFDLPRRAASLARRHQLPMPATIRWADDMTTRWGSCTPSTRTIRISDRLAAYPDWVVDYVIVHELAHLQAPGHGSDFWDLVRRYPSAERAIGYLMAKSGDDE